MGLVLQDVFVFSGDYARNIRLLDDNISDETVRQALTRVGFDRFLDDRSNGIHTEVKERGATLSTGQKQLLSFARALAFNPEILILDEATSSVDTETETLIQNALDELLKNRTSIIIAHRLSTIEKADKIIVLHHGKLREIGKHEELLKMKGIYYRLYQLQYRRQDLSSGSRTSVAGG
jgi:ABC-type multidrug transport system fused ATPase/permease subunit